MNVLKAILAERNMTLKQLAGLSGVSKRTLDPYLSGKAEWKNARASILLSVADALEIDPHALVQGKVEINISTEKEKMQKDKKNT